MGRPYRFATRRREIEKSKCSDYDMGMALKPIMIQVDPDRLGELDRAAGHRGMSRSALVREAIDELLSPPRPDGDLAERYRRAYGDDAPTHDDWGSFDAWDRAMDERRSDDDSHTW